ncbi:MAG: hypothetical protein M2R45_04784 [Verrucomicrobia subdivision 3 bacterium]|nr:hypothetical protein [Limisphaerales bacterium]MCS1417429.1 hypothetical protein [Limisphaerales bacterium]
MGFPPLIDRELRSAARNPQTYRLRLLSGLLTALVSLAFILPGAHNIALIGTTSRSVFWWMSGITMFYGMAMALFFAGDALASERRERTLELLYLTKLHSFDILIGKLISCGIGAVQTILAFSLTLALAMLAGGVTLTEFVRVGLLILNSVFLALAIGLLASCLSRDGRVATVLGLFILILFSALPLLPAATATPPGLTPNAYNPESWNLLSPLTSFRLCVSTTANATSPAFTQSLLLQHLASWGVLVLAAAWLTKSWRSDQSNSLHGLKRRSGVQVRHDNIARMLSKELLEENPIFWLLTLKYGSPIHRLGAAAIMTAASLLIYAAMTRWTSLTASAFAVMISWHVFVKLWVAWVASHLMTEMRRSGMLELTLTTPLDWRLILDGWLIGLKRVFLLPIAILFSVDLLIAYFGSHLTNAFSGTWWFICILVIVLSLAMETYALTWIGLFRGIVATSTTRAWLTSVGIILLLPWFGVACFFALGGVGFVTGVTPGVFNLFITRFVFGMLITVGATAWSIDQLRGHLQEHLARA